MSSRLVTLQPTPGGDCGGGHNTRGDFVYISSTLEVWQQKQQPSEFAVPIPNGSNL